MADDQIGKLDHMIDVIVRCIPKERQARDLYLATSKRASSEATKLLFEHLAEQEEQHEEKLRASMAMLQEEKSKLTG